MKTKYLLSAIVLISLLLVSGVASARPLNAALGTGFTYQGKLTDGGSPAIGTYDFEFKLFDALSVGSQVGSTVPQDNVTVTNGLFTVQLDFGNVFDGTALFLDIGVRPAGGGGYTPLTPRQALTATPFAIYAAKAPWSGLTNIPAGFADGVDDGSTYTAGSGLTLAGSQFSVNTTVIQARVSSACTAGNAIRVINANGTVTCESVAGGGASYQNVIIVAQSGGDYTSIQAALDSIIDASASNRYLIYVAPGVYTEQVTMKQYVDIEGAGELTTKITFTGIFFSGTVVGANDAELRFLTVENTGGADEATAIYNSSASPRLTHVTASASGGTTSNYSVSNYNSSPTMTDVTASASGGTSDNYGVINIVSSPAMTNVSASASGGPNNYGVSNSSSSPTMTNVTASASGGTGSNYGVYNSNSSSPTMMDVSASASEGTSGNYGVYNAYSSPAMMNVTASASWGTYSRGVYNYDSSSPAMMNVTASASWGAYNFGVHNSSSSPTMTNVTAKASGGMDSRGVYNSNSSSPTMTNVTASASGGVLYNNGVQNDSSSPTINNSAIRASGGSSANYGIYNTAPDGAYIVLVNNSQISGSNNTIYNDPNFTTRVGASQLDGGAVFVGGGTFTCVGAYDENYLALDATCQ